MGISSGIVDTSTWGCYRYSMVDGGELGMAGGRNRRLGVGNHHLD